MIDYESYNKVIEYLNNNKLKELRLYLEEEKKRW